MADEVDLRFLGEQLKRLQGDVSVLKFDMAQMRADNVKHEGDLDAFRESVVDRFDQQTELIKSSFRTLMSEIQTLKKS